MKNVFKKATIILAVISFFGFHSKAQIIDTITVKGDIDKFYVVTFKDGGWLSNAATELELGRSSVNVDGSWKGSLIAKVRFHVGNWGHGSEFLDVDIREANSHFPSTAYFIAGWTDATVDNNSYNMILWLRGNTTYYLRSNFPVDPVVYDGSSAQNPLSYKPSTTGAVYSVRAAVDPYVNTYGMSYSSTAYFNGIGVNYFGGSLGIGTRATGQYKLAVDGAIRARRVKLDQETWADFVFEPEYKLPSLQELETYIKENKHLPDVPSAREVTTGGLDLAEINKILLQKIEELTLHLIEQGKRNTELEKKVKVMTDRLEMLESK
jgi:hypothetical protein